MYRTPAVMFATGSVIERPRSDGCTNFANVEGMVCIRPWEGVPWRALESHVLMARGIAAGFRHDDLLDPGCEGLWKVHDTQRLGDPPVDAAVLDHLVEPESLGLFGVLLRDLGRDVGTLAQLLQAEVGLLGVGGPVLGEVDEGDRRPDAVVDAPVLQRGGVGREMRGER